MSNAEDNEIYELHADRKSGAFRNVPEGTRELWITMLRLDEAAELASLGKRLKRLRKLTLMHGDVQDVGFLESFDSLQALKCLLAGLKNFDGIGFCTELCDLSLGGALSSVGSLAFLQRLPHLERLRLEGPHPSKGLDQLAPMQALKTLNLYAPKWNITLLPKAWPAVESLSISQGAYQSLDFVAELKKLAILDIAFARKLTAFEAIGIHPHLQSVQIGHAIAGLQSCSQFGRSSTIRKIAISNCTNLSDVSALGDWPVLQEVELTQCPRIPASQIDALRKNGKKVKWK